MLAACFEGTGWRRQCVMSGEMFAITGKMRLPTYRGTKYEPLQLLCDTPQEVSGLGVALEPFQEGENCQ